jgi:hypothetical protein
VTSPKDADLKEAAARVRVIHDRGITTDIVLAEIPAGHRDRERYLTEIVARLGALNVTWMGVPA